MGVDYSFKYFYKPSSSTRLNDITIFTTIFYQGEKKIKNKKSCNGSRRLAPTSHPQSSHYEPQPPKTTCYTPRGLAPSPGLCTDLCFYSRSWLGDFLKVRCMFLAVYLSLCIAFLVSLPLFLTGLWSPSISFTSVSLELDSSENRVCAQ